MKKNGRGKLEQFLRRHAISNLSLIVIMCYGFGYVLRYVNADFLNYLTLNPYAICHGQVWRLISWVLVPPDSGNIFFVIIAMLFYYSIGTSLERTWGTYAYNRYIFGGILLTVVGAFVMMGVSYLVYRGQLTAAVAPSYFTAVSQYFSTYYVNMSIFLAYAATFPNATVLFMFIIPVKVKWLGIIYGIIMIYDFVVQAASGDWFVCIAMAASLANFFIYWLRSGAVRRLSPSEVKRRREFKRKVSKGERASGQGTQNNSGGNGNSAGMNIHMHSASASGARHRCAICGRTELDAPDLEFRYCSKCQGNYEFCQDHLFNHIHAAGGQGPRLIDGAGQKCKV